MSRATGRLSVPKSIRKNEMTTGRSTGSTSGSTAWETPTIGELQPLFEGFEFIAMLGRGGMGAVYKARQQSLGRFVAIKILPPPLEDDHFQSARRFENEAHLMARLNHPNIVSVHDFGRTADGRFYYFVMEFVDGADLAQVVRGSGHLSQDEALSIIRDVCRAIDYAHTRGIIHRDIKPSNILVNAEGQVKVADFGLARVVDPTDHSYAALTRTQVAMGTPEYAAPEVLAAEQAVDERSDLYSVGVLLYQMLTGEVPRGLFKMPSQRRPELDARFDAIICRAMEPDREDRYQTARDISRELDAISSPFPAAAPPAPLQEFAPVAGPRPRWLVPAALGAAATLLLGGLTLKGDRSKASKSSQASASAPTSPPPTSPLVDVNARPENAGNIAALATVSSNDDSCERGHALTMAIDGLVSAGAPGQDSFEDQYHATFDSFGTVDWGPYSASGNEVRLDFAPRVDLTELVAYVGSSRGKGAEDADRQVREVSFWVDNSGTPSQVATLVPEDTDEIGGFERVAVSGDWRNVRQVVFSFLPTGHKTTHAVRVAEVLTRGKPVGNGVPALPELGGDWTNLLEGLDTQRNALMDAWRLQDGELLTPEPNTGHQTIELSAPDPPRNYDLRVELTRHLGSAGLVIGFRHGETGGHVVIDTIDGGNGTRLAAIHSVHNAISVRNEMFLEEKKRHTVVLEVREASVTVSLDGEILFHWPADWAKLRQSDGFFFPSTLTRPIFAVGACSSDVTFHRVHMRAVE